MQSNNWDNFYQSGRVSDYLKYIDAVRNAADAQGVHSGKGDSSGSMESVQYAGKSDGDGAVRHTSW